MVEFASNPSAIAVHVQYNTGIRIGIFNDDVENNYTTLGCEGQWTVPWRLPTIKFSIWYPQIPI
jgi:hypothetical protein